VEEDAKTSKGPEAVKPKWVQRRKRLRCPSLDLSSGLEGRGIQLSSAGALHTAQRFLVHRVFTCVCVCVCVCVFVCVCVSGGV
jgi:hypothetical protein